ncbi:MAG: hypothetical protein JSW11_08815 [Candidatus Heimdallarchaeota archaeon]|nr:MAG: hypothetical protein JSW11_08815 [Candidatus Heimdallarchaeota archaeon]
MMFTEAERGRHNIFSFTFRAISAFTSVTLSVLYISLNFYYYLAPKDFAIYQATNFPYQLTLWITLLSLVLMVFFLLVTVLNIKLFTMDPEEYRSSVSESSWLASIWVIALFLTIFLFIIINDDSMFWLSLILGIFILVGLLIFVIQSFQGIEEKAYALSSAIFKRNYPINTERPSETTIKRRILFLDGLDYDYLITKDHIILLIAGAIFLALQGISAFPFIEEAFKTFVPLLRDLLAQIQLGWLVDLVLVPIFHLILAIASFISIPFTVYFDPELLEVLSKVVSMFSSLFVLFLFLTPVTRETVQVWREEMDTAQGAVETFKGRIARNRLYHLTKSGAFYLYCFGRVTYSFLMGFLLILQMDSGSSINEYVEIILFVLVAFYMIERGFSRTIFRTKGLEGYDSKDKGGGSRWSEDQ